MVGGNDYVVQVKNNKKKLKSAILNTIETQVPDDQFLLTEKNRGREEIRELYLYKNIRGPIYEEWLGLKEVIVMKRSGRRKGKEYKVWHYYISSRKGLSAKEYSSVIRNHWHIESKLHWVKDVIMYEDTSLIKNRDNASNQSLIRNIVLNVYKQNGDSSLKIAFEKYNNKIKECVNILLNNKYELFSSE